ncbi:MAG: family 2A encapsulin nanocompartment shell protein [Planctomycetota bacterium]
MPLNVRAAERLATTTKTPPMWEANTPRWLITLLPWVQVKAGVYRINRATATPEIMAEHAAGEALPTTFTPYDEKPKEITLTTVQTVVQVHTRVPDLYNVPHDQLREQLRIAIEAVKEEKERRMVNSADYGLLHVCAKHQRISTGGAAPTPDDLDNLLSMVWKKPAFFVAHPQGIAAFGRQCTARGVTPETIEMFGVPFMTWRGVPIVPCDKLPLKGGAGSKAKGKQTSAFMLLRVGETEQGVVGLHQAEIGTPELQSLAVRFMGIDGNAVSSYLVTCYYSVAVLVDDALAVLEDVDVSLPGGKEAK